MDQSNTGPHMKKNGPDLSKSRQIWCNAATSVPASTISTVTAIASAVASTHYVAVSSLSFPWGEAHTEMLFHLAYVTSLKLSWVNINVT